MKKILLAALFIIPLFASVNAINAADSSWISANSVQFAQEEYHKVTPGNPAPFSFLSNKQECVNMQFTIENSRVNDVCAVRVANGMVSNDDYVLLHGTKVARKLTSSSSKHSAFIPLRDSSKIIELKQISNKLVISIISDAYVLPSAQYGSATYDLPFINKTEKIVQYANSNIQPLSTSSISVSKNGKWLIGEAGNGFFTYDIENSLFRYVKKAYNKPTIATSVSNDGRYIITANNLGNFEITDTQECENSAPQNGTVAKCKSANYFSSIVQYLPTLATDVVLKKVQFDNNEQVSFYATHNFVSNTEYTVSKITMSLTSNSVKNYLALGDSFAAGEGAYNYRSGTDFADNRCHLSFDSYPYLLDGADLGSTQSVACSGAKTKDYYYSDEKQYNEKLSQANSKTTQDFDEEIYINYLPGHRLQYRFVEQDKPNIVTVSIGGNDIGFGKIVQKCVLSANDCFDNYEERAAIVSSIKNVYDELVDTYSRIKEEAAKDAHVYALGYPEIAKTDGNCAINVHLSNNEIKLGNDITAYLNSVIKKAANHAGVAYIDVSDALYGYRLCEIDSKDAAVNGLTAGDSAPIPEVGPLGSESFHPNKKGHEMYAVKIRQLTNSFSATMPEIVESNPHDTPLSEIPFVANAPIKGEPIFDTYYEDSLSEDVLYKDSTATIQLNTDSFALRADKEVRIELHSTPTTFGVILPTNGAINTTLSIPSSIEPGYHTLHMYGTNIDDEVIDIQKIVYVAASDIDYDGDGIANEDEVCLVGTPSGQDVDADSIDDACDGFINAAPTVQPPIDIVDEQPEVISTYKELPESESRPEWLLIKEREIAEEQAAANQSATVTPPEETTAQQNAPITTYPQQENEPENAANESTDQVPPSTQVAGVSSAVESKETLTETQNYWWLYIVVLVLFSLFGFGVYKYVTEENKV